MIAFFDKAAKQKERSEHLLAQADAARDERRWAKAAILYRKLLDQYSDRAAIWVQYGHALKESDRIDDAEAAYLRAIAHAPNEADTHVQLGHIHKIKGRTVEAIGCYKLALRLDRGLKSAQDELRGFGLYDETELPPVRSSASSGDRITDLEDRLATLEAKLQPAVKQFSALLDRLSDMRALHHEFLRQKQQLDRLNERLGRIEERLNFIGSAAPPIPYRTPRGGGEGTIAEPLMKNKP